MICFKISINGEEATTIGLGPHLGNYSAIIGMADRREGPPGTHYDGPLKEITINVGGLIDHGERRYEFLRWIDKHLSVGNEVSIRVVESDSFDEPKSRKMEDPEIKKKRKRDYYESLKKEFEKDINV